MQLYIWVFLLFLNSTQGISNPSNGKLSYKKCRTELYKDYEKCFVQKHQTEIKRYIYENTVSTLGSLHGHMISNPKYSIKAFYNALRSFNPDVILTEVRSDHANVIDGAIDGGIEQALVYAFGSEELVPIVAVDWFDDDQIKLLDEENSRPIAEEVQSEINEIQQNLFAIAKEGSLTEANSEDLQFAMARMYDLYERQGRAPHQDI